MITVKQVTTKKEQKRFVEFPLNLYKDSKCFVPPLYGDEMSIFKKDYMYADQAEWICFLAYKDGKVVGRIMAILQMAANKKWNQNRVRFTRFDSIDDQEVADALFAAAEDWAKEKGAEEVVGPLGFSDLEREGLLIEGFDEVSTFEEQYNYAYYQRLIENCGYVKDVDWSERQLRLPKDGMDPKIGILSQKMMEKYNLHFAEVKSTKELLKKYQDKIFALWDVAYDKIYGTVPFTENVKKSMVIQFKMVIDMRYIALILDENDNVVAFGLVFPSLSEALQKSGGKLTPCCLMKLLKAINHPKVVDLAIIGVIDEYKNRGISTALIARFGESMEKMNVEYAETNLTLETNNPIQNLWKRFDARLHKRRRCFVKRIVE